MPGEACKTGWGGGYSITRLHIFRSYHFKSSLKNLQNVRKQTKGCQYIFILPLHCSESTKRAQDSIDFFLIKSYSLPIAVYISLLEISAIFTVCYSQKRQKFINLLLEMDTCQENIYTQMVNGQGLSGSIFLRLGRKLIQPNNQHQQGVKTHQIF